LSKPVGRLLRFSRNRYQRLTDVQDVISERLQRWDACSDGDQTLNFAFKRLRPHISWA
jgi:hypothetical protein